MRSIILSWGAVLFILVAARLPLAAQSTQDAQIKAQETKRVTDSEWEKSRQLFDADEQEDLGTISPLKKAKAWFITPRAAVTGFWTSNALLANNGEKGDTVFVASQGVDAGYRFSSEWTMGAGYEHSLTRYVENPVLDTDANACNISTSYRLPWNISVSTGLKALWLTAPHQDVEVYRENNPYLNLSQWHPFFEERLVWFYGLQYDHHYANPINFDRDEYTASTGLAWSWLSNLMTQVALRQSYQFYDFREPPLLVNGRQEWVSTVALQSVWQPLDWLQISAFAVASYDNSVNFSRDYKVANLGGEIKAFWKF